MTITLTPITKNQWKEVGTVAVWVVVALACAAGLAFWDKGAKFLEATAPWLATPAVVNLLGVIGKQILTQEQAVAESHIPSQIEPAVQSAEANLQGQ